MEKGNAALLSAVSGIVVGVVGCGGSKTAATEPTSAPAGDSTAAAVDTAAPVADVGTEKACCKGQNECKGKGSCKVDGANGCAGKNECKGKGGCNTHCAKN